VRLYDLSEFRIVPVVGDGVVQVSALEDALEKEWLDRTDDRIFFRCRDRSLREESRYEDGRENEKTKGWNEVVHERISFRGFGGMVKFHLLRFCRIQTGLI
jgi:hypothetical protein